MSEYPKIPNVYRRESEKPHRLLEGVYTSPALQLLEDTSWMFTEKVDGTNIRIVWDGHKVTFAGRTDRAQLPAPLVEHLNDHFGGEAGEALFEQTFLSCPAVIYGEGYGAGIQKGGKYAADQRFVAFDAKVNDLWLEGGSFHDLAASLGVSTVPQMFVGATLPEAVALVRSGGLKSFWGDFEPEGVVGKPGVTLLDRRGERVMVKIKGGDFQ